MFDGFVGHGNVTKTLKSGLVPVGNSWNTFVRKCLDADERRAENYVPAKEVIRHHISYDFI